MYLHISFSTSSSFYSTSKSLSHQPPSSSGFAVAWAQLELSSHALARSTSEQQPLWPWRLFTGVWFIEMLGFFGDDLGYEGKQVSDVGRKEGSSLK